MKKLKTLKDFEFIYEELDLLNLKDNDEVILSSHLKAEAVKWVKEYHLCYCNNCGECYSFDKFISFFNLTEKDLEEEK